MALDDDADGADAYAAAAVDGVCCIMMDAGRAMHMDDWLIMMDDGCSVE